MKTKPGDLPTVSLSQCDLRKSSYLNIHSGMLTFQSLRHFPLFKKVQSPDGKRNYKFQYVLLLHDLSIKESLVRSKKKVRSSSLYKYIILTKEVEDVLQMPKSWLDKLKTITQSSQPLVLAGIWWYTHMSFRDITQIEMTILATGKQRFIY